MDKEIFDKKKKDCAAFGPPILTTINQNYLIIELLNEISNKLDKK